MSITFGSHTFSSSDLRLTGLDSPAADFVGQPFLDGGYQMTFGAVLGKTFSLSAVLDTTGRDHKLFGVIRWNDILALRSLSNSPKAFSHPRLDRLGVTGVTACFDKSSLNSLTFYAPPGMAEPIDPALDTCYPGTNLLLCWYGSLNFIRMS